MNSVALIKGWTFRVSPSRSPRLFMHHAVILLSRYSYHKLVIIRQICLRIWALPCFSLFVILKLKQSTITAIICILETDSYHQKSGRTKPKTKKNSMVWVSEWTIPTERPPLVGEVIANFCGQRVPRGQRDGSLLPYSRFSRQEPLLFYRVAPQLYSRGWVDPVPDALLFFLVVPGIEPGPPDL
jgi:hypothetical protein